MPKKPMKWKCRKCGDKVTSSPTGEQTDWCKCRKTAVQFDKSGTKLIGNPLVSGAKAKKKKK